MNPRPTGEAVAEGGWLTARGAVVGSLEPEGRAMGEGVSTARGSSVDSVGASEEARGENVACREEGAGVDADPGANLIATNSSAPVSVQDPPKINPPTESNPTNER